MDVSSGSAWIAAKLDDLQVGDFFSANMGGVDVLALLCEQDGDRFGLILAASGADHDLSAHPPPAGRSLGTLSSTVLKFTGKAIARPGVEDPDAATPGFPALRTTVQHGDLVLDLQGTPWIFVHDYVSGTRTFDSFANLQTGAIGRPAGGGIHGRWDLLAVDGKKLGAAMARFGR
jgi:hypothetical protein